MYTHFENVLKSKGLKPSDVSKATKIASSTLTDWKMGRTTPKLDKLEKIAEFLGVSVEFLTTGKESSFPEFEPEHIELISLYSKLNKEQKNIVLTMIRSLVP